MGNCFGFKTQTIRALKSIHDNQKVPVSVRNKSLRTVATMQVESNKKTLLSLNNKLIKIMTDKKNLSDKKMDIYNEELAFVRSAKIANPTN